MLMRLRQTNVSRKNTITNVDQVFLRCFFKLVLFSSSSLHSEIYSGIPAVPMVSLTESRSVTVSVADTLVCEESPVDINDASSRKVNSHVTHARQRRNKS